MTFAKVAQDSQLVARTGEPLYVGRYLHGEIYRLRPNIHAVVQGHSLGVIPFGVSGVPLRSLCHQAAFPPGATRAFEVPDTAGEDNAILITSKLHGSAVARALGNNPLFLMRGCPNTDAFVTSGLRVSMKWNLS